LQQGDRILCLHTGKFDTTFVTTEETCCVLPAETQPTQAVSYMLPLTSAVHLIQNVCSVKQGTSVLIDCAGEVLNVALVQVALRQGAGVSATYTTPDEKLLLKSFPQANLVPATEVADQASKYHIVLSNKSSNVSQTFGDMVSAGGHIVLVGQHSAGSVTGDVMELLERGITTSIADPVRAILSGTIPVRA
jgi:NADPH:quinone reductase-like Zn-dependent oxidoreductase